jgi:hypothetical protein
MHDDTYNETKRQAAFRWLSEQASCGTAAKHGPFSWHGALFVSMAAALIGIMGVLMALH